MSNLNTFFKDMSRRIKLMVARSVIQLVDDSTGIQSVQISLLRNELRDGVERLQNYGMTSVPLAGAEAATIFVGGNRDHGVVIAVDDRRYRVKGLADGEVCLYTDEDSGNDGHRIHFKRGGIIEINCTNAVVNAGNDITATAGNDATVAAGNNAKVEAAAKATIEAGGSVDITAGAGLNINVTGTSTMTGTGDVIIGTSGNVDLGGTGGNGVARIGDNVTIGAGSSAGVWPITGGSAKVKAT